MAFTPYLTMVDNSFAVKCFTAHPTSLAITSSFSVQSFLWRFSSSKGLSSLATACPLPEHCALSLFTLLLMQIDESHRLSPSLPCRTMGRGQCSWWLQGLSLMENFLGVSKFNSSCRISSVDIGGLIGIVILLKASASSFETNVGQHCFSENCLSHGRQWTCSPERPDEIGEVLVELEGQNSRDL